MSEHDTATGRAALGELYGLWGNRWDAAKLPLADDAYRQATELAPHHATLQVVEARIDEARTREFAERAKFQAKYDEEFGALEAIGCYGTWEPCHKLLLGNYIVGVENLGGDLEKVVNKRFRFFAFPIRWHLGDGSMVRCVAEIDEDDLNDVPTRTYTYGAM